MRTSSPKPKPSASGVRLVARGLAYGLGVWTPEPSEALERDLHAALARPGALHIRPPRPVALTTEAKATGWLWGQMPIDGSGWLGLATIHRGRFFEGAQLGWHRAEDLRTLD